MGAALNSGSFSQYGTGNYTETLVYLPHIFVITDPFVICASGTGQSRVANPPSVPLYSAPHTQYEIFQMYKLIFSNKYKYQHNFSENMEIMTN